MNVTIDLMSNLIYMFNDLFPSINLFHLSYSAVFNPHACSLEHVDEILLTN